MAEKNKVIVEIFNEKYTLFCEKEGEEENIRKIASLVDRKMKEIYKATKLSSALKLAVLTALNLAEDLYIKKENPEPQVNPEFTKRILRLVDKLEDIMKETHAEK